MLVCVCVDREHACDTRGEKQDVPDSLSFSALGSEAANVSSPASDLNVCLLCSPPVGLPPAQIQEEEPRR